MFDTILARIVQLSGGRGAALISVDGLAIDAVDENGRSVAPDEATRDYASVLKQLSSAGEAMEAVCQATSAVARRCCGGRIEGI